MTEKIKCPCCGSYDVEDFDYYNGDDKRCSSCECQWHESKRQPVNEWISCSERMPEECADVLVYDGKDIFTDWLIDENESSWGNLEEITHWQPLPEPPAAGKDGE